MHEVLRTIWEKRRCPPAASPFHDGFTFLSGGGGLVSTARDYARFGRMLAAGGVYAGRRRREETVRQMLTDQLGGQAGASGLALVSSCGR